MGDKHKLKKPKSEQGKRIATDEDKAIDTFNLPPKFCLRQLRHGYSLTDCEKDEKAAFADRLYELSRLTWAQIRQAGRHGQGYEKIDRNAFRGDKVPDTISADVNIIAFRCIGLAPMVGYRSADGVLNILWIDRALTLYKHG
jgi:hypothetical protein